MTKSEDEGTKFKCSAATFPEIYSYDGMADGPPAELLLQPSSAREDGWCRTTRTTGINRQ